jgi:hypothetical protein
MRRPGLRAGRCGRQAVLRSPRPEPHSPPAHPIEDFPRPRARTEPARSWWWPPASFGCAQDRLRGREVAERLCHSDRPAQAAAGAAVPLPSVGCTGQPGREAGRAPARTPPAGTRPASRPCPRMRILRPGPRPPPPLGLRLDITLARYVATWAGLREEAAERQVAPVRAPPQPVLSAAEGGLAVVVSTSPAPSVPSPLMRPGPAALPLPGPRAAGPALSTITPPRPPPSGPWEGPRAPASSDAARGPSLRAVPCSSRLSRRRRHRPPRRRKGARRRSVEPQAKPRAGWRTAGGRRPSSCSLPAIVPPGRGLRCLGAGVSPSGRRARSEGTDCFGHGGGS